MVCLEERGLGLGIVGMLKKSASGVLGLLSCSRTHLYALRAKSPVALLDEPF